MDATSLFLITVPIALDQPQTDRRVRNDRKGASWNLGHLRQFDDSCGAVREAFEQSNFQPDVLLSPQQEAGVQAAISDPRSGKFEEAMTILCDLPIEMAREMLKADPEISFAGAVANFENLIAGNLGWMIEMLRKYVLK